MTSLHACPCLYSTWCVPGGHSSNYGPGPALPNFSDRANTDELTPYSVYKICYLTVSFGLDAFGFANLVMRRNL